MIANGSGCVTVGKPIEAMKVKQLGSNQTLVETDSGVRVFFSYQTPVAAFVPGSGYCVTELKWSRTTSKHIAKWLSSEGATNPRPYAQEFLDGLLGY